MNFFKLYIGDYQRDTAHLSIAEHGAYMLMLQHYYATEKPLPEGKSLHRMLRAQDKSERDAIDAVADQFWTRSSEGLINGRADAEIVKANAQAETNGRIAKEREAHRKAQRDKHEQSTNRATNDQPNQTPDTNTNTPPPPDGGSDPAGFAEFWDSWPQSPRKVARKQCCAKWKRHGLKSQLPAILAHVEAMKHSKQWRDGYEPAPLTYLNQERWGDGLPVEAETQTESGYL